MDGLAAAIRRALDDPAYRSDTEALRDKIHNEDGAAPVVELVTRLVSAKIG